MHSDSVKDIFRHSGTLTELHAPFPRKLVKDVLYQNKRVNQKRTRHGIKDKASPTWEKEEKNPWMTA